MNFRRLLLTFHYSQGFACIPEAEGSSRFRFEGSCQENLLDSSVFVVGPGKRKRKAGNIRQLKVLCVRLRRRPVYPAVLLIHHAVCDRHVVQGILVTASHAGFLLLSLRWRRVLQRLAGFRRTLQRSFVRSNLSGLFKLIIQSKRLDRRKFAVFAFYACSL